jgi:NADPH:quinone reductase
MRSAVVDKGGPPESFRIVDLPVPSPNDSEIVIRQKYAAVNFGDVIRRKRGLFSPKMSPPYVLGFEGVGNIESVGSSVKEFGVGDRVAYLAELGAYGEFVAVQAAQAWAIPQTITDEAAAGITCVGLTAWGLVRESGVKPGDIALVHGAAGGVGTILIQILAGDGIRTVALVTGAEKRSFVTALGAEVVLDRANGDPKSEIKKHFPTGTDVIFDCVGQDVLDLNLATIKAGGMWMYYGSTSGHSQFPGDRLLMNRLSLKGFVIFDFARDPSAWKQGIAFLSSSLVRGSLTPQITRIFALDQVSEAHRLLEARSITGKVLLKF